MYEKMEKHNQEFKEREEKKAQGVEFAPGTPSVSKHQFKS